MKIEAIGDRIIARQIKIKKQSESGIVLSEGAMETLAGDVIAIGGDVKNVSVGDKVIYLENVIFELEGEKLITFTENKVIGKIVQ